MRLREIVLPWACATVLLVLMLGTTIEPASALQVAATLAPDTGSSNWQQVSAGGYHSCAITTSSRLFCWGDDASGQLGDGGSNTNQPTPVEVAGHAADWAAVSAGGTYTCALKNTGRLYCWGSDATGELGDGGANSARNVPTQVTGNATDWASVSAGSQHTCAVKTSGRLFCWGADYDGELGDDAALAEQQVPSEVAGRSTQWASASAGFSHTCAVKTNGRLYCWGSDYNGRLGNGVIYANQPTPSPVAGDATNWASVSAGGGHTCARKTTRRLFCWGWDGEGQLGDNTPLASRRRPVVVAGGSTKWSTVSAGAGHTCATKTTGRVYCWGSDDNGRLGNNAAFADAHTPVQVFGHTTDWETVDGGAMHTCAIRTSLRAYCWGYNGTGQVGNDLQLIDHPIPTDVAEP